MTQLNGFFSLRTPHDLLDKLEFDYKRLTEASTESIQAQYAAFDFFVGAEHMPDWLKYTKGGSLNLYRDYPEGPIVSHVASGAKHFQVTKPQHTSVKNTESNGGIFDPDIFDADIFDCDSSLVIELENGVKEDVIELANRVLLYWQEKLLELS